VSCVCRLSAAVAGRVFAWQRGGLVLVVVMFAVSGLFLIAPSRSRADGLSALAGDCPACATTAGGDRVVAIFGEMNGTPPLSWYPTDTPPPVQGWAAQSEQDLSALEADTSTTSASGADVGAGLMGGASEAGFLASPTDLLLAIGPVALVGADAVVLVHDGGLLFHAVFGSAPQAPWSCSDKPLGWITSYDYPTLGDNFAGPDLSLAEQALGDDDWNSPGWWAWWEIGGDAGNTATEVWSGCDAPEPSVGTPLSWTGGWGHDAQYLLARDIPGLVEPYTASSPQPDVTLSAPALPSEQDAMSNLNTVLAQPEYHTLRLELQHILDPRCSPDPTSQTVQVPTILPDESSSDYQDCLLTLGLSANVTTLAETDTTVGDGGVVETDPEPGSSVQPGATVNVAVNPQTPQVSQKDSRCDVDNGAGSSGDPGNPPSDGTNYPAYQLVQDSPYPAAVDPTGESPAQSEVPLRWGTVGWGWRHILDHDHPYTSADQEQTMQALATDTNPTPGGFASTNQWDFHLFYSESDGSGGTIQCLRTVRVEYYQDPKAANAGVQGIRGIQNSYTGLYDGGLPGH
jgi:hypothetical protein